MSLQDVISTSRILIYTHDTIISIGRAGLSTPFKADDLFLKYKDGTG
jgi:hypothetical protein